MIQFYYEKCSQQLIYNMIIPYNDGYVYEDEDVGVEDHCLE